MMSSTGRANEGWFGYGAWPAPKTAACTTKRNHEEQPALAEPIADERGAGERHGAEQALLPEARLERVGDRGEPRRVRRQDVRVEQRFGGRPPAEDARREQIEQDVVGEEERDEQVPAGGPAEDRRWSCPGPRRPDAPELRVMRRTPPASVFRRP